MMHRYETMQFMAEGDIQFHMFPFSAAGRTVAPHCHEFVEFVYIYSGTGIHEYQGTKYKVSAGDVFVIEPEAVHAYYVESGQKLELFNVLFQPSFFAKELGLLSAESSFVHFYFLEPYIRASSPYPTHLHLQPHQRVTLQLMLDQMFAEYKEKQMGYRIVLKTKLMEIFIYLSRCYLQREQAPIAREPSEQNLMDRIKRFVEIYYNESTDLQQLCQMCGMSKSVFRLKFKAHTGLSLLDYRTGLRIGVAKQLLQQTDLPVSEIALEVGYNDISFFNRMFRERCRMSPRQFRQTGRKSD